MTRNAQHKRRTTMVPVTTMEEIPILDEKERTERIRLARGGGGRHQGGKVDEVTEDIQGSAHPDLQGQEALELHVIPTAHRSTRAARDRGVRGCTSATTVSSSQSSRSTG